MALSEGTFLGHREIGLRVFSQIFYGGSWAEMRSPHKISAQSEVVSLLNLCFEKTSKVCTLPAEFHIGMAVDVEVRLG